LATLAVLTTTLWGKGPLNGKGGEKFALALFPCGGSNCSDEVSLIDDEVSLPEWPGSVTSIVVAAFASQSSPVPLFDKMTTGIIDAGFFDVATSPVHAVAAFALLTPLMAMINPIRTAAFLTELFDIAPSTVRGPFDRILCKTALNISVYKVTRTSLQVILSKRLILSKSGL